MFRRRTSQTCPGLEKFLRPTPSFIKCPFCGADVEIWSDEDSAICDNCGRRVRRDQEEVSCLDYCPYAEKCREILASLKREEYQGK